MAARKFKDDISEATKKRRLTEIVEAQRAHGAYRTQEFVGKTTQVLIERSSKKDQNQWSGRNQQSIVVVFPKQTYQPGDFVDVKILRCTSATLIGEALGLSNIQQLKN
jgi:tRNA-2-methylthio-N6-dimethylallyladenosine synthase